MCKLPRADQGRGEVMRIAGLAAVALLAASVGSTTIAAPREISVKSSESYKHKETKLALPPSLGGLPRHRVAELEAVALDVLIDYRSADGADVTTIFLYRNAAGDVPMWFDRATKLIEGSTDKYGSVKAATAPVAFVPPGQGSASGLRVAYAATNSSYASTAVAILPLGDYYLKLRLSSGSLTPAQLDARLTETLAAIDWPRKIAASSVAIPIQDCEAALTFTGDAKPAPNDGAAALMSALMPSLAHGLARSGAGTATPVRYCRDPKVVDLAGLYRPNGDKERYLIALADSGRALQVGKNDLSSLLGAGEGKQATPRYSVDLILLAENQGFGDFLSLPTPEQVMTLIETASPTYRTSTVGKKNNITINTDALGN